MPFKFFVGDHVTYSETAKVPGRGTDIGEVLGYYDGSNPIVLLTHPENHDIYVGPYRAVVINENCLEKYELHQSK